MPAETLFVVAAVLVMFGAFAGTLAWAGSRSRPR